MELSINFSRNPNPIHQFLVSSSRVNETLLEKFFHESKERKGEKEEEEEKKKYS